MDSILVATETRTERRGEEAGAPSARLTTLAALDVASWRELTETTLDPNGFFDPAVSLAATHCSKGAADKALAAFSGTRLTGLLPVTSGWGAYRLPISVLVGHQAYATLGTPLLEQRNPAAAAGALIDAAAHAGKHLLVIPDMPLDDPAAAAFETAARQRGVQRFVHNTRQRAALAVPADAEIYLREGFGARRLKELRRQRHRMEDEGEVGFVVADTPTGVEGALQRFLALEASGWKGKRGTALDQSAGDAKFITDMATGLTANGQFEIAELTLAGRTIAAGLVVHQRDHALFFKIAYDETMGRFSPGVQLTVELTRRFAALGRTKYVDSTAIAGHPMIDHVWRERRQIGDLYIPTIANDAIGPVLMSVILLRAAARERVKRLYHHIRSLKEKRS
ncbi:MAG: hypothetical protein JWR75_1630 [Devosia sp.]|nr:hypothetical protein [Devosia sp.]